MKKELFTATLALLLIVVGSSKVFSEAHPPRVVASIKPIHALVSGVMQGVAEPTLLIKGGGSPHGYVLRPSEAKALADADLVVWVGHSLETFLEKPLENLARNARTLELLEAVKNDLLPIRKTGSFDAHSHREAHRDGAHTVLPE
jgi:zinc transport system substrate-binding protein